MTQPARPAARTARPRPAKVAVDLDLSTLDVEESEPFAVRLPSGATVRLRNIADLDWQAATRLDQSAPFDYFTTLLLEEDAEAFFAEKLSLKQMREIGKLYREKFELDLGESPA